MTGKLDEISRAIGGLEAKMESFGYSLDRDRMLANERHRENTQSLERIDGRVENLEHTVSPLAQTVTRMEPIVRSMEIRGWKRAGAIGLASTIVAGLAWTLIEFLGKAGGWIMSLLHFK